jgi:Acyl-CoA dehydrogenases
MPRRSTRRPRYPQEAHDALVASDFFAPHVPEEYDGVGADALATCIVIEEVARADASASLIPAVNKLGSMPVILGGSEAIKAKYLRRWHVEKPDSPTGCPNVRPARTPRA